LALVVNSLATRVNKFTESDDDKLLYCLQYLNNTRHLGLLVRVKSECRIQIICHADASFGIRAEGKSQSARVSSASEVLGLRNYMVTRNLTGQKAILVQDNQSAATIMTNGLSSVRRTKHMALKYFYVEDGQMEVRYCCCSISAHFLVIADQRN
jgi:hypothetical protein